MKFRFNTYLPMVKYALVLAAVFAFSACESGSAKERNGSVSKQRNQVDPIDEPPGILGCWQLSKVGYNLKDIKDESKWHDQSEHTILLLRIDGKYKKWYGDYGDSGDFELRNDSLFLNGKNNEVSDVCRVYRLTSSDMVLTRENSPMKIEKYQRASRKSFDFWNSKL